MKTIFKYPLKIVDAQSIGMPVEAEILSVQEQNGQVCLWARVDSNFPMCPREILIVGTGNPTPLNIERYEFVGTVQTAGGALVWHVFAEPEQ